MIYRKFYLLTCFLLIALDQTEATAWGVGKEKIFYSEEQKISTAYSNSPRLNGPRPLTYQQNKFFEYGVTEYLNVGYHDSSEKIVFKNELTPVITSKKIAGFAKIYKDLDEYSSLAVKLCLGKQKFLTHQSSFLTTTIAYGTGFRFLEKNNFLEIEISLEKGTEFAKPRQYDLTYGLKNNNSLNMLKFSFLPKDNSREISVLKTFYIGDGSNLVASFFLSKNQDLNEVNYRKNYIKKGFSISIWKGL